MRAPIAETFHSIQGEGVWTGTLMFFIRLAGCTVGKYPVGEERVPSVGDRGKPAWRCHTWDGRPFWCDTDFTKYEDKETRDLVREAHEPHICLTGGEPLMHETVVDELVNEVTLQKKMLHIETSGTIWWEKPEMGVHLTVSPKKGCTPGMIRQADEVKLLVDSNFDPLKLPSIPDWQRVFIQPINGMMAIDRHNLQKCLDLLKTYPHWRLSTQLHKLIGVR